MKTLSKVLVVNGSFNEPSNTGDLFVSVLEGLAAARPGDTQSIEIVVSDVGTGGNPWAIEVAEPERASYRAAEIEDLLTADAVIIISPIYNFSAPVGIKLWAEMVAEAGVTFNYTQNGPVGLLDPEVPVLILSTSGGVEIGSDLDFGLPWLKFFLSFLGLGEPEVISVSGFANPGDELNSAIAEARIAAYNYGFEVLGGER